MSEDFKKFDEFLKANAPKAPAAPKDESLQILAKLRQPFPVVKLGAFAVAASLLLVLWVNLSAGPPVTDAQLESFMADAYDVANIESEEFDY